MTARSKIDRAALTLAVVKVGNGGRGFIVEDKRRNRIVITAVHCLTGSGRQLPPAHPFSYLQERTYANLLGPLGKAKPQVWAQCLFADPLADIAVLGSPDGQELYEQSQAYEQLVDAVTPLTIVDAPKQGTEWVRPAYYRGVGKLQAFKVPTPGKGAALVLSLDNKWRDCTVTRHGYGLSVDQDKLIKSGMSGSPILAATGHAIGLVSTGILNPVLVEALPPRIGLKAK
jgi:hypothetical protein